MGGKTGKGRSAEIRIVREVVFAGDIDIGKVAVPPARDTNLIPNPLCVVKYNDLALPLPCLYSAQQARCTRSDNNTVHDKKEERFNLVKKSPGSYAPGLS